MELRGEIYCPAKAQPLELLRVPCEKPIQLYRKRRPLED